MKKSDQLLPKARKTQLLTKDVGGELIIYDLKADRAHCLNPAAMLVWMHCDGQTTVKTMAGLLKEELKVPVGSDVVWFALNQLKKSDLLEDASEGPYGHQLLNRRSLVLRLGVAAAVTLPLIRSITAPTAAQAATCLPNGAACVTDSACCSNNCVDNGRGQFQCS